MCTFKHPVYESEHHGAGNINIFGHWYTVAIVKAIHNKSKSAEIGFMWSFKSRTSPLWISLTRAFALWTPFKVFQDFPGYKIKSPRRKTCFQKKNVLTSMPIVAFNDSLNSVQIHEPQTEKSTIKLEKN